MTELRQLGACAVGLTGLDGELVHARRRPALEVVGEPRPAARRRRPGARIVDVRPRLLELLLDTGFLPVLSPLALDPIVGPVAVETDRLAAAVAGALRADRLVLLSAAPGVPRDPADAATLVRRIGGDLEERARLATGETSARLVAAREALDAGVPQVVVAGEGPAPVRRALAGAGTTIERSPASTRAAG